MKYINHSQLRFSNLTYSSGMVFFEQGPSGSPAQVENENWEPQEVENLEDGGQQVKYLDENGTLRKLARYDEDGRRVAIEIFDKYGAPIEKKYYGTERFKKIAEEGGKALQDLQKASNKLWESAENLLESPEAKGLAVRMALQEHPAEDAIHFIDKISTMPEGQRAKAIRRFCIKKLKVKLKGGAITYAKAFQRAVKTKPDGHFYDQSVIDAYDFFNELDKSQTKRNSTNTDVA